MDSLLLLDAGLEPVLLPDLDGVLDVERPPPRQRARAERQARERKRAQHERPGETAAPGAKRSVSYHQVRY